MKRKIILFILVIIIIVALIIMFLIWKNNNVEISEETNTIQLTPTNTEVAGTNSEDNNISYNVDISSENSSSTSSESENVETENTEIDHTAQRWVSNWVTVVDTPSQTITGAQLYTLHSDGNWYGDGEVYWFENGFTSDDFKEILRDKIRNEGYIGKYVNRYKTIPAATHEEDQGYYETYVDYQYCDCGAKKVNSYMLLEFQYCNNALLALGLTENFILFNNHYFFGFKDIDDQVVIGLGGIYSKLEQIRIMNSNLKLEQINGAEQIKDISYPCSVADLMGRKIKYIIETTILRDNRKSYPFSFNNYDYKRFIILLYYHSIFTFYYSREHLSKDYENGVADFYIFPNDLEPICTLIQNQVNSTSKTNSFINYDSGIGNTTNAEFNEAFYCEKGISFDNFNNLMKGFIESSDKKNLTKSKISKEQLDLILLETYPNINLDTFHKECILNKFNIEYDEENLIVSIDWIQPL